jgi:hypothetical protein
MTKLFESRAAVLEYEARERVLAREIELLKLRRLTTINAQLLEALCCVRDMVGHPDNLAFIDAAIAAAKGEA